MRNLLFIILFVISNYGYAQNRREQIEILTFEKDSLITLLNIEVVKGEMQKEKLESEIKENQKGIDNLNDQLKNCREANIKNNISNTRKIDSLNSVIYRLNESIKLSEDSEKPKEVQTEIKQPEVILLVKNKEISLYNFPSDELKDSKEVKYIDVNSDGTNEILIEYFTGGAHCCYEYSIFQKRDNGKYSILYEFSGGENSVKLKGNKLTINFYEQLGYFYSSYANRIDDKLPYKYNLSYINKVYKNGIYQLAPTDEGFNQKIIKNLEYLSTIPPTNYQSKKNDEGIRKAYAEHITAYYFNNQENIVTTKKVFDKYYKGNDGNQIFKEILELFNSLN
jgi:hypothetical protein